MSTEMIQQIPKGVDGTWFAFIYDGEGQLGDVTLFSDGTATVMNSWSGIQQWFDNHETGHEDAMRYILGRMTPTPRFV